jgi:hypothetical protein
MIVRQALPAGTLVTVTGPDRGCGSAVTLRAAAALRWSYGADSPAYRLPSLTPQGQPARA